VSRYRWTILGIGTGAQASYSAVFLGVPVLAPALRAEYGLSLTGVGFVIAASTLGSVPTLLPWGLLADRFGERAVLSGGLALAGAALVVAAFAPALPLLVGGLTVAGAAGAAVNAASGRAVMGWFAPAERGFALGIRQTAVPLGGAAAALVLPPAAAAGGVRAGLLVLAGGCLAAGLAGLAGLREARIAADEPLGDVTHPLRDGRIWRLAVAGAFYVVAQTSVLAFTVLFLHEVRGLSTTAAGAVLALMLVLGAALRIASGWWSDRVRSRVPPLRRLGVALAASLALTAALTEGGLVLLLPAFVVAGALSQSWNALSFTATAELAGRAKSGAALGLQQTALSVAGAATPVLFAAVVATISWPVGFGLAAILPLAGVTVLRKLAV
jgi:sugar phosphate permease